MVQSSPSQTSVTVVISGCLPVLCSLVGGVGSCRRLRVVCRVLDQAWVCWYAIPAAVARGLLNNEACRTRQGRALNVLAWVCNHEGLLPGDFVQLLVSGSQKL